MKINDYKVGTSFEITCTKHQHNKTGEIVYENFGIDKKFTGVYGKKPEDVIKVRCMITEEDIIIKNLYRDKTYDTNSIDYLGFIDGFEKNDLHISMIWRNIKLYMVCFPYGPDSQRFWEYDQKNYDTCEYEFKKGDRRAMTVRLKVEEI